MAKSNDTFVLRCLFGDALVEDADDFVHAWHNDPEDTRSLPAAMGLTDQEYGLWVEQPAFLKYLLFSRQTGLPIKRVLEAPQSLAARAGSKPEADKLWAWLKKTGRIDSVP